jgi:hypothetical protein
MPRTVLVTAALLVALLAAGPGARGQEPDAPRFDQAFWKHWSDGRAEVASYELTFTRYGEARTGTAVTVFVTEPFSEERRVKADRPGPDSFQVMKLNLAQDFPTGVYDYHLMTSAFVGLEPSGGRSAGSLAKVTFSSQEWCGHVFHQLLFDRDVVRETRHSYFDGEEGAQRIPLRGAALSEDALFHWARGMAGPRLAPGESRSVSLLTSAQHARLRHTSVAVSQATLSRASAPATAEVPAGTFEADVYTAKLAAGRSWTFHIERAAPRRILRWASSSGHEGRLVGAQRMPYWRLSGNRDVGAVKRLGLSPRPPRTP